MSKRTRESVEMVEVPKSMWALATRRGGDHIVRYRSLEDNMGHAYLQGFHDALIASGYLPHSTPESSQ